MKSGFAQVVEELFPESAQPMAPVLISKSRTGNTEILVYALPTASEDGQPLAAGAFTKLHAYAEKKGVIGTLEAWAGLEPKVSMPAEVGGPNVTVEIPNLEYGNKYSFTARVE